MRLDLKSFYLIAGLAMTTKAAPITSNNNSTYKSSTITRTPQFTQHIPLMQTLSPPPSHHHKRNGNGKIDGKLCKKAANVCYRQTTHDFPTCREILRQAGVCWTSFQEYHGVEMAEFEEWPGDKVKSGVEEVEPIASPGPLVLSMTIPSTSVGAEVTIATLAAAAATTSPALAKRNTPHGEASYKTFEKECRETKKVCLKYMKSDERKCVNILKWAGLCWADQDVALIEERGAPP
jgi:hypothetical protein